MLSTTVAVQTASLLFEYRNDPGGEQMSKLLRGIDAGYGARKLGGGCGCFGTIVVFIILWYLLGNFGIFQ